MPPKPGCKNCWQVWYFKMIADTPPHLRKERVDMLEALLRKANEDVLAGRFDIELFARPEFTVEKADDSILTKK